MNEYFMGENFPPVSDDRLLHLQLEAFSEAIPTSTDPGPTVVDAVGATAPNMDTQRDGWFVLSCAIRVPYINNNLLRLFARAVTLADFRPNCRSRCPDASEANDEYSLGRR
ncbi:hypothetical protein EVAR_19350_1 [Eumeta japonica]|uniref:Uncharacterized protein n=1 Tax=Eumeta variegata TaxID=151549 RepID=A0A4C1TRC9_EUMVA|nr:hypothetical protein EVAR_19350_1 [Eumeta japonica]